jgi:alcohol dehydrogenase (cytochrome c)
MSGSYDPELDLVFWGTGVAQHLRREQLKDAANKDLLYTNSTVAVNPDTGKMVWYYQHLPADFRDLDHPFERMIVETAVSPSVDEVPWINPTIKPGERRKVVTGIPGKTGIVWTLDAKTGEFLWARPTTVQTVMAGVDPKTGRPILDESERSYSCPFLYGGKNQPSGAYSPDTNAMYMPLNNVCNAVPFWDQPGRGPTHVPGADPARSPVGRVEAISAATGRTLWKYEQRGPVYGSILATGGNLVFSGDVVRRFRAFHAASGKILWETILNGPVSSRPMTYSVGGRQYLAVGAGGVTQGSAYLALAPELSTTRGGGNTMFVFALPQR